MEFCLTLFLLSVAITIKFLHKSVFVYLLVRAAKQFMHLSTNGLRTDQIKYVTCTKC